MEGNCDRGQAERMLCKYDSSGFISKKPKMIALGYVFVILLEFKNSYTNGSVPAPMGFLKHLNIISASSYDGTLLKVSGYFVAASVSADADFRTQRNPRFFIIKNVIKRKSKFKRLENIFYLLYKNMEFFGVPQKNLGGLHLCDTPA